MITGIATGPGRGLTSLAQGGKFKHGFFSGMFASMAGSEIEASGWGVFSTDAGQLVTAAVVGGTAAKLGGGKLPRIIALPLSPGIAQLPVSPMKS
ncbi:MAG: hypothetical protein AB2L24_03805 [Mangrovibacterium sp.]